MSSNRRQWYRWFPGKYLSDPRIGALSCMADLVCRRMIDAIAVSSDRSITSDINELYKMVGVNLGYSEFVSVINELQYPGFSVFRELPNKRLTLDLFEVDVRYESDRRRPTDLAAKKTSTFASDRWLGGRS